MLFYFREKPSMSPHDSKSGPNTIKLDQDEKKFNQVCLIQKLNILSEQTCNSIVSADSDRAQYPSCSVPRFVAGRGKCQGLSWPAGEDQEGEDGGGGGGDEDQQLSSTTRQEVGEKLVEKLDIQLFLLDVSQREQLLTMANWFVYIWSRDCYRESWRNVFD